MEKHKTNRRKFVKNSALAAGGVMAMPLASHAGFYSGSAPKESKVALVGCGGRGTGAAVQALIANEDVKLVAMADAFRDRLEGSLRSIIGEFDNADERGDVPENRRYVGFDEYEAAVDHAGVVIVGTSAGISTIHV